MLALLINVKKLGKLLTKIMENIISIRTLKEIVKMTLLILFLNLIFVFLSICLCKKINNVVLDNKFKNISLNFITKKNYLSTLISFDEFSDKQCKIKHSERFCQKWAKNEQFINLEKEKDIYEIQFEIKLIFMEKVQNFIYDFDIFNYNSKKKKNSQGFMFQKDEMFLKKNFLDIFETDHSFVSKKFVLDFRNFDRPVFADLKLKMIKDQTFIKDIIIHVHKKCHIFTNIFYDFQNYFFLFFFFVFVTFFNIFTLIVLSFVYFFRIATFFENLNIEVEDDQKKIGTWNIYDQIKGFIFY